ncbi:MAG: thioredoxin [Ruminococcaceae bacterium]|nr:thioredoxin [Oscillospiraceae bacterium]
MKEINLTVENFDTEVMQSDKPVLVDFWAPWCGPCRMLAPVIEEIAEERNDIKVCKVNTDEASELAAKFAISSIPTLLVVKNGEIVQRQSGFRPKKDVLKLLD